MDFGLVLQTDPPVPARELRTEVDAFDAAVRQIELELKPPPAPTSRQRAVATPRQAPVAPRPAAAPPRPAPPPKPVPAAPPPHLPDLAIPPEVVGVTPDEDAAPQQEFVSEETSPASEFQPRAKKPRSPAQIGILIGIAALLFAGAVAFVLWGGNEVPAPRRPVNISARPDTTTRKADETANLQYVLRRQLVYYRTVQPPGTIVIAKSQHFLYVVRPDSVGLRYTFGMGPDCAELGGLYKISRKEGDTQNAKAAALYVGDTNCRIRQIDPPGNIGQSVRTPGIQLAEDDFSDLFEHTNADTRVVVSN
ncbi:MAG: hypothetical protein ACXWKA_09545 [Xanthobacteraceae bacterium]